MDWTVLPGFDEKYAKVKFKQYKTFGGKVVEVLYGAKDENGNPVSPKEGANDGHGRWFGIEVDGERRMFSLQHSAEEGGAVEYGTPSGDNALSDLLATIAKKQELCRAAEDALRSGSAETMEQIKAEWDSLTDWNTPKEAEFQERLNGTFANYESMQARAAENTAEKQSIVDQAKELVDSTDWRNTQAKFRELSQAIHSIGRSNDNLEDQFHELMNSFNARRKEYFENLDSVRAAAKDIKTELIAKAAEVAEITNFKAASDKMNELMSSWKAAGSAGHSVDEELWAQFNEVRQGFYDKRKAFFEEREAQRQESIAAKNALIEEAKKISESGDFSKEVTDRMKELDKEWKATGFSGKEEGDRLWALFKETKEVFWDGKHADSQKRFQDIIDRKEAQIKTLREEINELGIKEYETDDFDEIRGIQRAKENKQDLIEELEADIDGLKHKLD